jgi:hypothetical protein
MMPITSMAEICNTFALNAHKGHLYFVPLPVRVEVAEPNDCVEEEMKL